jgi:hypothetical protein
MVDQSTNGPKIEGSNTAAAINFFVADGGTI